jgi:hypothetical protein
MGDMGSLPWWTVEANQMKSNGSILLPLGQVLKCGIPIFVVVLIAVAGGVFKLTMFSTQQHVSALQTQLEAANGRASEAEGRLRATATNESASPIAVKQSLPEVTRKAAKDVNSVDELARKLSAVERERDTLIQELSQKALGSLDPNSELPVLLSQLGSSEQEVRRHAVPGLFALKDRRSFAHLTAYFRTHTEEATHGDFSLWDWYYLFIDLDPHGAMEIVVEGLDSQEFLGSYTAYETLNRRINTVDLIEVAKPCLESFALRSPNSFARTRAKVLLDNLRQRKVDIIKEMEKAKADTDGNDKRSSREILYSIERTVMKLTGTDPNKAHPVSGTKD